jgi:hypothetical protein
MEASQMSDEEIMRGLREHPQIRDRIAALLAVVNDAAGDLKRADDAEDRLIEEIRELGREAMRTWAQGQVEQTEEDIRRTGRAHREGKKNSAGTPRSGT